MADFYEYFAIKYNIYFSNVCVFLVNQKIPRWKHCVLAAERGFDSVLIHLLKNVTAHKEVKKKP